MALVSRRIRGRAPSGDYWPGFVDAMSSLLLVLIFLLSIFMLTQFFLAKSITGKDSALDRLREERHPPGVSDIFAHFDGPAG